MTYEPKGKGQEVAGWVIVIAAVAIATALMLGGCAQPDAPMREPEASTVRHEYLIPSPVLNRPVRVIEFSDSSGRACVLVVWNGRIALDCGRVLPAFDYDELPEASDDRGIGKRPL